MAVWLLVYGNNGLGNFDTQKTLEYLDILNSVPINGNKSFESLLDIKYEPPHRESLLTAYSDFQQSKTPPEWKITANKNEYANFTYDLQINKFQPQDLCVSIHNDLIFIRGLFDVFSRYFIFQREISNKSREFYHQYFKDILKAFKSDFILYTHEWAGIVYDDEEINSKILLNNAAPQMPGAIDIHEMQNLYFERL